MLKKFKIKMTYKILIIGSNGLLGSLLFKKIKNGNNVIGTTNRNKKKIQIKCNITKKEEVFRTIQKIKPDIIIHLAGITGNLECEKNPHKTLETNVMGTYYILEAIKNKKIRLIFASSREVYGNSNYKVNENSLRYSSNMNGITKMISENLILDYHLKYKTSFNILRFTNFYGENNEKRGISKMIKDSLMNKKIIIYGGNQYIDLIHYDDAVNAIVKTIEHEKNGIFNIGLGKSVKLLSLIKILENASKSKINFKIKKSRNVDTQKFSMDVSKSKKELGFKAKITPEIGIKRMVTKWERN